MPIFTRSCRGGHILSATAVSHIIAVAAERSPGNSAELLALTWPTRLLSHYTVVLWSQHEPPFLWRKSNVKIITSIKYLSSRQEQKNSQAGTQPAGNPECRKEVLVHADCYNKRAPTGGLSTTEICFLWFWSLEVPDKGGSIVGWESSSGPQTFLCVLTWWKELGRSCGSLFMSLIKGTSVILLIKALASWPNQLPKASPSNTITLGFEWVF